MRDRSGPVRLRAVVGIHSRWLFAARRGGHTASKTLAAALQRHARREGISITSHTGRRYCISRLAEVDLLAAIQQAGHVYLSTTQKYVRQDRTALHRVLGAYDPLRT